MDLLVILVTIGGILLENNVKCDFGRLPIKTYSSIEFNSTISTTNSNDGVFAMPNSNIETYPGSIINPNGSEGVLAMPNGNDGTFALRNGNIGTFDDTISMSNDEKQFNPANSEGKLRSDVRDDGKVFVLIPITEEDINMRTQDDNVDQFAHANDDASVAETLNEQVRVLCWVMTSSDEHDRKAFHVKQTWGKRCNKLLFFSSKDDTDLPAVRIGDGDKYSWEMTMEAYRYIYLYHLYEADWFLQVDDVTYVVVENLRYMLINYNTTDAIYFGSSIRSPSYFSKQVFRSSRAGVVLSREAVTRFIVEIVQAHSRCDMHPKSVDEQQVARCLNMIGVRGVETKDLHQRGRLFPDSVENILNPKVDSDWYWTNIHRSKTGRDCCSEQAVTFHNVSSNMMYALEYFIYHLRPYGIRNNYNLNYL